MRFLISWLDQRTGVSKAARAVTDWFDHRTGFRKTLHEALYERIPGGARWRYVWGSTLVYAFVVQVITGIALWTAYSPSATSAWESVYFIQYEMTGGWLVRGLHHFMAQAMVVLLALHLMQVVIDGAYKAPREINFWLGLILAKIVLGLALTGYLLPWDQKGYWATQVATNLAGIVPVVGPQLKQMAVGGSEYGHHTLTRFFALHTGLLPGLLIGFLAMHIALFRRHGITTKQPHKKGDAYFWPDQVLKDGVACLAVLAVVLGLTIWKHGAELTAPADPANEYSAARPEWYFLSLFQMLKLPAFAGENEVYGAIGVPGLVFFFLALMPVLGKWKLGHFFNVGFLVCLLIGAGILTFQAVRQDVLDVAQYQPAVKRGNADAERAIELAKQYGIPPTGAVGLLRNDPLTQGSKLFAANCASCHSFDSGRQGPYDVVAKESSAPNLHGFATQQWIEGLLDPVKYNSPAYFGKTAHTTGEMLGYLQGDGAALTADDKKAIAAALAAEAGKTAKDAVLIAKGKEIMQKTCVNCHRFHDAGELGTAPDLTAYGSRDWLIDFISDPTHARFYPETNDRMPSFGKSNQLERDKIEMIVDWIRISQGELEN